MKSKLFHKETVFYFLTTILLVSCSESSRQSNIEPSIAIGSVPETFVEIDSEWIKSNLIVEDQQSAYYVDLLETLRFHENYSDDAVTYLRQIWKNREFQNFQIDVRAKETAGILLAAILTSHDYDNFSEYHDFVVDRTSHPDFMVRGRALLILGEVGGAKDLPILEAALSDDRTTPAIQAGIGLIAMGIPQAIVILENYLQEISGSEIVRDQQVYSTLNSTLAGWNEIQRN